MNTHSTPSRAKQLRKGIWHADCARSDAFRASVTSMADRPSRSVVHARTLDQLLKASSAGLNTLIDLKVDRRR